jgi:hypothetical protein
MNGFRRLWRGELALADAFWTWAVLGGLLVNVTTSVALLYLVMEDRPIAALVAGYVLSIPYNVIVSVGVWRSAERDEGDRRRAEFIRIGTVVCMALLSLT